MATIKSYTDINQSKMLAKILPLESADCFWDYDDMQKFHRISWFEDGYNKESQLRLNENNVCAWSLSALLEIIPRNLKIVLAVNDYWDGNAVKYKYAIGSVEHNNYDCYADNHVDACYELIIKLHEQNLL